MRGRAAGGCACWGLIFPGFKRVVVRRGRCKIHNPCSFSVFGTFVGFVIAVFFAPYFFFFLLKFPAAPRRSCLPSARSTAVMVGVSVTSWFYSLAPALLRCCRSPRVIGRLQADDGGGDRGLRPGCPQGRRRLQGGRQLRGGPAAEHAGQEGRLSLRSLPGREDWHLCRGKRGPHSCFFLSVFALLALVHPIEPGSRCSIDLFGE